MRGITLWMPFSRMLVYGDLADAYPLSGGLQVYAQRAFGPLAGLVSAFLYWFSGVAANAAFVTGFRSYAQVFVPSLREPTWAFLLAQAVLWTFTLVNVVGVKANTDGHERFGPFNRINQNGPQEMGRRTTARNLNLNRDFIAIVLSKEIPVTLSAARLGWRRASAAPRFTACPHRGRPAWPGCPPARSLQAG
jgi:hypothetical protein